MTVQPRPNNPAPFRGTLKRSLYMLHTKRTATILSAGTPVLVEVSLPEKVGFAYSEYEKRPLFTIRTPTDYFRIVMQEELNELVERNKEE